MAKNKPVGNLRQPGLQPQARPIDAFAGGGTQQAGTGAGQLAEALGVAAEVVEQKRQEKEKEDLRLVDFYADQFMKDKEAGLADKVAVGELFPDKSSIIKSRITEAVGKRYATEQARNMMDELLADENLRYDSDARRLFYEQKKQQLSEEIKDRPFFGAGALEGLNSVFNQFEYQLQQEGAKEHLETLKESYSSKLNDAMEDAFQNKTTFDIKVFESTFKDTGLNQSTRKELFVDQLTTRALLQANKPVDDLKSARPGKTAKEIYEEVVKSIPEDMRGDQATELKLAKLKGDLINITAANLRAAQNDEEQSLFQQKQKKLKDFFEAAGDPKKLEKILTSPPRDFLFSKTENGNVYKTDTFDNFRTLQSKGANPNTSKITKNDYLKRIRIIGIGDENPTQQLDKELDAIAKDPRLSETDKLDLISNIDQYANAYSFVEREVANAEKENLKARVQNQIELIQSDIGFRERTGGRFLAALNNDDPLRFAENRYDEYMFEFISEAIRNKQSVLDADLREASKSIFEKVQTELKQQYPVLFNVERIKQLYDEGEVDIPNFRDITQDPTTRKQLIEFIKANPDLFKE